MVMGVYFLATHRGPWVTRERQLLEELRYAFQSQGRDVTCVHGITDEGDAWADFHDTHTDELLAHIARDGRRHVLVWPDESALRAVSLSTFLSLVRQRYLPTTEYSNSRVQR
jgi:hypothetical protein